MNNVKKINLGQIWTVVAIFAVVFLGIVALVLYSASSSKKYSATVQFDSTKEVGNEVDGFLSQNINLLNSIAVNYENIIYLDSLNNYNGYSAGIAQNKEDLFNYLKTTDFLGMEIIDDNGNPIQDLSFMNSSSLPLQNNYYNDNNFKAVLSNGQTYISSVSLINNGGKSVPVATIFFPFQAGGSNPSKYVILGFLNLNSLENYIQNESFNSFVIDKSGNVVLDKNMGDINKTSFSTSIIYVPVIYDKTTFDGVSNSYNYVANNVRMFVTAAPLKETDWAVITEAPYSGVSNKYTVVIDITIISIIIFILMLIFVIWNMRSLSSFISFSEKEINEKTAIMQSTIHGILEYDQNIKILYMNSNLEKMLAISAENIVGKTINSNTLKTDPSLTPLVEILFPFLAPKLKSIKLEENVYPKIIEIAIDMPENMNLRITTNPVIDKNKNIIGFIKFIEDITQEEALSEMKTEFMFVVVHQLRTPLSAMKWSLKMFMDGDLGSLTSEQADFIKKSYSTNERMIRLVSNLLDVSRIEENKFNYVFAPSNLSDLVKRVVDDFSQRAQEKQISLTYNPPVKPLSLIKIDSDKLYMALSNIVENSIDYTLKGGWVNVSLVEESGYAKVVVQDNGIGVPEEQIDRLFDRFFRASNAIRIRTEGSGLGLYIAKDIVKNHGGDILVSSKENEGSIFTIALPLGDAKSK